MGDPLVYSLTHSPPPPLVRDAGTQTQTQTHADTHTHTHADAQTDRQKQKQNGTETERGSVSHAVTSTLVSCLAPPPQDLRASHHLTFVRLCLSSDASA